MSSASSSDSSSDSSSEASSSSASGSDVEESSNRIQQQDSDDDEVEREEPHVRADDDEEEEDDDNGPTQRQVPVDDDEDEDEEEQESKPQIKNERSQEEDYGEEEVENPDMDNIRLNQSDAEDAEGPTQAQRPELSQDESMDAEAREEGGEDREHPVDEDDEEVEDKKPDMKGILPSDSDEDEEEEGRQFVHNDMMEEGEAPEEGEGEEEEEQQIPDTRIESDFPPIVTDIGDEIHFVKLPNFLSVETHPFDPQWYEDEIDEEEVHDEEYRPRLKLRVENTLRWRMKTDENGEQKPESNARVVKWSDGSMSLHLGSEIFDIYKQPLHSDNQHLFIRQGTGLIGQAIFRQKLSFRPYSTESFTHRKLTLSLADRSQKTKAIRVLPFVGADPEAHRTEMIKKEEDKLKASIKRENKQKRVRERSHTRGPSASYLEPDEEDEEGAVSLGAIKSRYKMGLYGRGDESEEDEEEMDASERIKDESDSDDDIFGRKKKEKKKAAVVEDSDEDL